MSKNRAIILQIKKPIAKNYQEILLLFPSYSVYTTNDPLSFFYTFNTTNFLVYSPTLAFHALFANPMQHASTMIAKCSRNIIVFIPLVRGQFLMILKAHATLKATKKNTKNGESLNWIILWYSLKFSQQPTKKSIIKIKRPDTASCLLSCMQLY